MRIEELTLTAPASEPACLAPVTPFCDSCLARDFNFCGSLFGERQSARPSKHPPLTQTFEAIRARDVIYHAEQSSDHVVAICDGWAFRFHRLRDGRRHILSFLIAGDVISVGSLQKGSSSFSVQALTDVRLCRFNRDEVKTRLLDNAATFDDWLDRGATLQRQADRMAVALGRFLAHERIAWLILQLRDRLAARGLIAGDEFEFPLRQSHIADATGLTTVHVCRVLNSFRKDRLFTIRDGTLCLFDLPKLRRIADVM
jgi:CRP-like cAMP-binding protein